MAIIKHTVLYEEENLKVELAWDDEPFDTELPSPKLWFSIDVSGRLPVPAPGWLAPVSVEALSSVIEQLERVRGIAQGLVSARGEFEKWWSQSVPGPPT